MANPIPPGPATPSSQHRLAGLSLLFTGCLFNQSDTHRAAKPPTTSPSCSCTACELKTCKQNRYCFSSPTFGSSSRSAAQALHIDTAGTVFLWKSRIFSCHVVPQPKREHGCSRGKQQVPHGHWDHTVSSLIRTLPKQISGCWAGAAVQGIFYAF